MVQNALKCLLRQNLTPLPWLSECHIFKGTFEKKKKGEKGGITIHISFLKILTSVDISGGKYNLMKISIMFLLFLK